MADDTMDESDLFSSSPAQTPSKGPPQSDRPKTPANQNSRFDAEEAREAALRRELEGVRNINEVIEGVIGTLEGARGDMGTVSKTVGNASTLLNTWTRILSQTEHNQRLILNPNWKGATQDVLDVENEALAQQQEAARRVADAERRREEARRKAEEDERQRQAPAPSRGSTRGTRSSRVRGLTRGGSRGTSSTSTSNIPSARTVSGIGRGFGSTRGRGRAT